MSYAGYLKKNNKQNKQKKKKKEKRKKRNANLSHTKYFLVLFCIFYFTFIQSMNIKNYD